MTLANWTNKNSLKASHTRLRKAFQPDTRFFTRVFARTEHSSTQNAQPLYTPLFECIRWWFNMWHSQPN